ncbi:MAG TPA: ZIP family metal transporter [Streptosporangiaceae bacterium]|nr:ZIP family metal transporter [Streptosporangiaceae bacterium]
MNEAQTLLLGTIAGGTIVLGLPLGRLRRPGLNLRQFLNAFAIGILVFLLWDVLAHAWEPVDRALVDLHSGAADIGPVLGYGGLFLLGTAVGLFSLTYYERWMDRRASVSATNNGDARGPALTGPGTWTAARRLSLLIAVGIGLHNFGEGLAIGGSAASGEISLATVLVIGFGLHNATEGFGIVAPLAAEGDRPSWRFLLMLGAIGGGPTLFGTAVGGQFNSAAMSVVFLTLAAGSILYVIVQLLAVALRSDRRELLYWGLFAGLVAGFVTDMVVTAGGA